MASERIIYLHGSPGGLGELNLFGDAIAKSVSHFHCIDRNDLFRADQHDDHFGFLAQTIAERFPNDPIRLVGFSLGASTALRVAPFLAEQVSHIDLISAGAPLSMGSYLQDMAGAPVFNLARMSPLLFAGMTKMQSVIAGIAPERLFNMLFASAQGEDKALAQNAEFRAAMSEVLVASMTGSLSAYRRDIQRYIENWQGELDRVSQPVRIFHGNQDNWSPPAMAQDLADRLKQCQAPILFDGLSHYSALREYLSQV